MDDLIGPSIPKHLLPPKRDKQDTGDEPDITPSSKRSRKDNSHSKDYDSVSREGVDVTQSSCNIFGPTLPPDSIMQDSNAESYGPQLPPDMADIEPDTGLSISDVPVLSDDEEFIGPMPTASSSDHSQQIVQEINTRSQKMKDKLTTKDSATKPHREEWMMELPPEIRLESIGLGPRKFKTKYHEVGDRSVWTRMPGDQAKETDKKDKTDNKAEYIQTVRNQQLANEVDKYNSKYRSESLVEMHKKKKAQKSKDESIPERRPFDRETDLINPHKVMTSSKRAGLIRDSEKSLDSKFSRGKSSFL